MWAASHQTRPPSSPEERFIHSCFSGITVNYTIQFVKNKKIKDSFKHNIRRQKIRIPPLPPPAAEWAGSSLKRRRLWSNTPHPTAPVRPESPPDRVLRQWWRCKGQMRKAAVGQRAMHCVRGSSVCEGAIWRGRSLGQGERGYMKGPKMAEQRKEPPLKVVWFFSDVKTVPGQQRPNDHTLRESTLWHISQCFYEKLCGCLMMGMTWIQTCLWLYLDAFSNKWKCVWTKMDGWGAGFLSAAA